MCCLSRLLAGITPQLMHFSDVRPSASLVNVSLQGITQQDEGGFRFVVHASWRDENHHVEGHHAEGHDIDGHHVAGDYE